MTEWIRSADATALGDRVRLPQLVVGDGGDLEVLGLLGMGGMARVDRALHRVMEREVAIKRVLHPQNQRALSGLLREAVLGGQLQHPNIVPVHFVGETVEGEPVVVMQAVGGTTWSDDIEARPHALADHLRVFDALCRAVAYAHDRGVLHRDLKPDNVRIGDFGEVYLLDWGIACSLDLEQVPPAGTPAYMPCEGVAPGAPDVRFDVHCLGATLLHLCTGGVPGRTTESGQALLLPVEVPSDLPPGLDAVVKRACAVQPGDRYPSVDALREAVTRWQSDIEVRRLLDAAEQRRRELDAAEEIHVARERFAVARFAYEQVRAARPDNDEADRGLRSCIEILIRREARAGERDAVTALLELHPQPPDDLLASAEATLAALEASAAETERLATMAREQDVSTSRRALGIVLLTTAASTSSWVVGILLLFGPAEMDAPDIHLRLLGLAIPLTLSVWGIGLWVWRDLGSPAGRRALQTMMAVVLVILGIRMLSWGFDLRMANDVSAALICESALGLGIGLGGMFFSRWFFVPAAVSAISLPVVAALLEHPSVGLVYNAAVLVWIVALTVTWNRATQNVDDGHSPTP